MGRLIPTHRGYTGSLIPPRELLEPLIEKTPTHWWWDGDVTLFEHVDKVSTFRWKPPAERTAVFVVVRVLWVYRTDMQALVKPRLHNMCGTMWCVNPEHVEQERPKSLLTITPKTVMRDGVAVYLAHANARVHIVSSDTNYAACGWRMKNTLGAVLEGTPITCPDCLSTWRQRGYALVEVLHVPP